MLLCHLGIFCLLRSQEMMEFWEKVIVYDDLFLVLFVLFFSFCLMFYLIWEDK